MRRPTPHDPPVNRPSDLATAFLRDWLPYDVPPVRARVGEAPAAAPDGIRASLLANPGPGGPAAGGDATTSTAVGGSEAAGRWGATAMRSAVAQPADPRPDQSESGPGGGGHP